LGLVLDALFIFTCRVVDVSLGTIRLLLLVRGKRVQAALVGFFEVLVFIHALGRVVGHIDNPVKLLAYASGFASGCILGSLLEEKITTGYQTVHVVLPQVKADTDLQVEGGRFRRHSCSRRGARGHSQYGNDDARTKGVAGGVESHRLGIARRLHHCAGHQAAPRRDIRTQWQMRLADAGGRRWYALTVGRGTRSDRSGLREGI